MERVLNGRPQTEGREIRWGIIAEVLGREGNGDGEISGAYTALSSPLDLHVSAI